MPLKFITILALSALLTPLSAQQKDTINFTDAKGLKQGHWIKRDQLNRIIYEGVFRDDRPVGTFRRFYENGKVQSELTYHADGATADALFFHPGGSVASKGRYVRQLKEGKWQFFSSVIEGYLIGEEEYLNNKRNGLSVRYYPDRKLSEKLTYSNDVRTGDWIQYYPDGTIAIQAKYVDGKLHGTYTVYFNNGKPEFRGEYANDAREGTWIKFSREGTVLEKINYVRGLATNPELYIKETRYLDSLERNKGKIADPEKTGTIW